MDIIALFCEIDDFLLLFEEWLQTKALPSPVGEKKRKRRLHTSEVMTILVYFHQSKYRTFKDYYLKIDDSNISIFTSSIVSPAAMHPGRSGT